MGCTPPKAILLIFKFVSTAGHCQRKHRSTTFGEPAHLYPVRNQKLWFVPFLFINWERLWSRCSRQLCRWVCKRFQVHIIAAQAEEQKMGTHKEKRRCSQCDKFNLLWGYYFILVNTLIIWRGHTRESKTDEVVQASAQSRNGAFR